MLTMSTPTHVSAVTEPDGLGLGVGDGDGDGVGHGDGELDFDARGDAVGAGFAEPCDSGAAMRLRDAPGLLVTGAESTMRCRAPLRATTW